MNALSFARAWQLITLSLVMSASGAFAGGANAQNIPTDDLIRQMTGKNLAASTASKVDESRERSIEGRIQEEEMKAAPTGSAPTLKEFSPIELEFQNRAGQDALRDKLISAVQEARVAYVEGKSAGNEDDIRMMEQELLQHFGHELFVGMKAVSGTYLGRIQDNYIIGVGDELAITLVGNNASSSIAPVDREGKITVSGLKPLSVAGRTFSDVRKDLSDQVSASMVGTELYLSMGGLRRVNVQVIGQVKQPGNIVIDSSSDLLTALIKSGGINKTGSLRRVKVISNGKSRTVDLYDVLLGNDVDLSISDGARIIVPIIGQTVAVEGKILRPAIYELTDNKALSLQGLVALGGGALRPGGTLYRRSFVAADGRLKLSSLHDLETNIIVGDLVSVYYESWRPERGVRARGHVRSQQTFILDDKPTVSALLKQGEMLQDDAYPYFSVLRRQDTISGKFNYQAINLAPIVAGIKDVALTEGDELIVLSESDIKFLNSNILRSILINVEGNPLTPDGLMGQPVIGAAQCQSVQPLIMERQSSKFDRVITLYGASSSAVISRIPSNEACAEIFEDNELLLPFVLEHVVALQGAVRSSGLFPVIENVSIGELVSYAGGLIKHADLSHVDSALIQDVDDLSVERRVYDFTSVSMNSVSVSAGSRFTFHSSGYDLETGSILLQGQVKRPGRYAIKRGDTLSGVIRRAGGLTENAYPFGSIFSRTSVRAQQQEHMSRSIRDIRAALAYTALKRDNVIINEDIINLLMDGPDDVGASALGRMVVETDPDVLDARAELDILLEPDDVLFVPTRPSYILLAGDVLNAGALQFDADKTIEDYLAQAGGLQVTADDDRIYVVYPNGIAEPIHRSYWSQANIALTPGTTIVVPKDLAPIDGLRMVREITGILSQMAVSVASLAIIASN